MIAKVRNMLMGIVAVVAAWVFVLSPFQHMTLIEILGNSFLLSFRVLLSFLNAVVAKRFRLSIWVGFALGFFLPYIAGPILVYLGKRKGSI